tara:strand:- start:626 stop:1348 length:723 start_codon:yes stop_codon:yes gene_type:complete
MGGFANNAPIVTDGLVFYVDAGNSNSYPGSGGTWSDLVGGNNGALTNGPTFDSGDGGSIDFDGSDDKVLYGSNGASILNGLTELTLQVWYKADTTNNDMGIIFGKTSNDNADATFGMRFDKSGGTGGGSQVIKSGFGDNNTNQIESSSNIQSTDWICITVTCVLGTSIKLYKNGIEDTPTATRIASSGANPISGATDIAIGVGAKSAVFNGKIPVVSIYNRALSSSEILQNYNALKNRFV